MKRSGKYAYVDGIPCTVGWGYNRQANVSRYIASCVPGASGAVAGNIAETGSMNGVGYLPPMPTEDDIPFVGVASAQLGSYLSYEGDIVISETSIQIPVASGGPITWSANFAVQGELEKVTTTPYIDLSRDPAPAAKDASVVLADLTTQWEASEEVACQSINMTFRRSMASTVEAGLTYYETGNLEAEVSFEVSNDDLLYAPYQPNEVRLLRVYVAEGVYYEFDAMIFSGLSNFKVDRSDNSIIGYTVNALWTALTARDPEVEGQKLGHILLPGGDPLYESEGSS